MIICLAAGGCSRVTRTPPSPSNSQPDPVTLTLSAAVSLQNVLQTVGKIYTQEHPHIQLRFNFGGSGILAQQIDQGAPVDVFLSANEEFMNRLGAKGLILNGTRSDFLSNELVLVIPNQKNRSNLSSFKDLTGARVKRFSMGQPDSVPAGQYAREVLIWLKIYDQLQPKTVFAKNVRQVLTYVETGNVEAGIVYATDARLSNQVNVIATAPKGSHQPIVYPVAVLKRTANPEAAKEFVDFLASDRAQKFFKQYGFVIDQEKP